MHKKIIFLDIDGVLNSTEQFIARSYHHNLSHNNFIDPVKLGLLHYIVEVTNAKLVITSSWRLGRKYPWFVEYFYMQSDKTWEFPPVIDCTPVSRSIKSIRGDEIQSWLDENGCTEYVILDDDTDMLESQQSHFIHVNGTGGLTIKDVLDCIKILGIEKQSKVMDVESLRELSNYDN